MIQKTIKPPPNCFSCGKPLPEEDFNQFHALKKRMIDEEKIKNIKLIEELNLKTEEKFKYSSDKKHLDSSDSEESDDENYVSTDIFIDENAIEKIILDGKLSTPYIRICCRTMFIGDAIEYRTLSALYDSSKICASIDEKELNL
jgi:DNA-directed RNA polymerase subunit N (RpoN/RPB10)